MTMGTVSLDKLVFHNAVPDNLSSTRYSISSLINNSITQEDHLNEMHQRKFPDKKKGAILMIPDTPTYTVLLV